MNRSSSFVILDESEDMGSSAFATDCVVYFGNFFIPGSEDLVESLLVKNASKGPCETADALSTSPLLLTPQSDLESSSWAVLDASKTTSETTQTPKDTFLMTDTKNEEVVVNDSEAEEVPALAAAAELPPISAEGEMEASVERPSESDAQISSLSSPLERAFDFIQFLRNLFAHFDGTTKKAAVTVLVLSGKLTSFPRLTEPIIFSADFGAISA
ncbi:unnamed protein product [Dibothriocephalus latus]|uniref:Uncharacterized protein n=1 Tax=Dibothriocephalus latus TaxID=60516 RepID=A0A3P6TNA4_DIBLA|nr:unnamed protein product [Dibothriocephalus latus]